MMSKPEIEKRIRQIDSLMFSSGAESAGTEYFIMGSRYMAETRAGDRRAVKKTKKEMSAMAARIERGARLQAERRRLAVMLDPGHIPARIGARLVDTIRGIFSRGGGQVCRQPASSSAR